MSISIQNLNVYTPGKSYKLLCEDLNVSFSQGKITALIGCNGSGKTTLIKMLSGLYINEPHKVLLFNKKLSQYSLKEKAKLLAYLPQNPQLYHDLLVKELILLGRAPYKNFFSSFKSWNENDNDKKEVLSALTKVGMEKFLERNIFSLSGGELQRILLARMLVSGAKVFIMDEPTTFLDPDKSLDFFKVCSQLASKGTTIICASHNLYLIKKFAHYVLKINSNQTWQFGIPQQIIT